MDNPQNQQIYQNTQHAIVEAIHTLGQNSAYNDGSVRMKEIYAFVKDSIIIIDGQPQHGPHRFSMFNSALVGRRSSQEIFESVDEPTRQGAWWKLKLPYESAIELALKQKGNKTQQERVKKPNFTAQIQKPQGYFSFNRSLMIEDFNTIQKFIQKVRNLREENKNLENHLNNLNAEIALLKQTSSPEVLSMLEIYLRAVQQCQTLKNKLYLAQSQLNQASQNSFSHQDLMLE